jgi:drug/metabolite transporter (DMT)-like permease
VDRAPPARTGELLALGAAVAFSMKAIFVKLAYAAGAEPMGLLSARMLFAAPIFAVIAWRTAPAGVSRRDVAALCVLGLLGYHAAAALDFAGLQYVSAGLERIVLYVHPTLVVLMTAALGRRAIVGRELGGVLLAWTGLVVAVSGDLRFGEADQVALGVGLVLACAVCYAGYLVGAEAIGKRLGTVFVASVATAISAVTLSVQVAATEPASLTGLPAAGVGYAAVLAVVSTVVPVALLAAAIHRIGPSRASAIGMIGPTLAAVLGWAVLGEPLSILQLGGGLVVVAGVSLSRPRR